MLYLPHRGMKPFLVGDDNGFKHHVLGKLQAVGIELLEAHELHIRKIAARVQEREIEIELLQEKINRLEDVEQQLERELAHSSDGNVMRPQLSQKSHDSHLPIHQFHDRGSGMLDLVHRFSAASKLSAHSGTTTSSHNKSKPKRHHPRHPHHDKGKDEATKHSGGHGIASFFGFRRKSGPEHHSDAKQGAHAKRHGEHHCDENMQGDSPAVVSSTPEAPVERSEGSPAGPGGPAPVAPVEPAWQLPGQHQQQDRSTASSNGCFSDDEVDAMTMPPSQSPSGVSDMGMLARGTGSSLPLPIAVSGSTPRSKVSQMQTARQRAAGRASGLEADDEREQRRNSAGWPGGGARFSTLQIPSARSSTASSNCTNRVSTGSRGDSSSPSSFLLDMQNKASSSLRGASPRGSGRATTSPPAPSMAMAAPPPVRCDPPPLLVQDATVAQGESHFMPNVMEPELSEPISPRSNTEKSPKAVGFSMAVGKTLSESAHESPFQPAASNKSGEAHFEAQINCFALHSTWFGDKQVTKISQASGGLGRTTLFDDDISNSSSSSGGEDEEEEKMAISSRFRLKARKVCSKIMIHPNSGFRMVWDMIAAVLVTWECIFVPLAFLEVQGNKFFSSMEWFVRIFWSFDMIFSFLTGYVRSEGLAEMRSWVVCKRYLKTWFLLDFLMVAVDWVEVFLSGVSSLTAARLGKFMKSIRMIRMARLWRVLRIKSLPNCLKNTLEYYFQSEVIGIVMAILKILMLVIWINHVIACVWYGIGDGSSTDNNWLTQNEVRGESHKFYAYWTAFHWSLSQFTGNMEVVPYNLAERIYAVVTLLIIFVIGASSVSSITASITNLSIATAQESKKLSILKQYLYEHRISGRIALRVQRNAQYVVAEQKRNTPEERIELLGLISEPLRIELHFEIHMPVLSSHPLFKNYGEVCPGFLRQVCHQAVNRIRLSKGDVLFSEGEVDAVPHMFFVVAGSLKYAHSRSECYYSICPIQWVCEACLWTPWIHCGSMRARSECALLALEAERVAHIAVQFHAHVSYAQRYGHGFVKHINSQDYAYLTDLEDDEMNINWLAEKSLPAKKDLYAQRSYDNLEKLKKTKRHGKVTEMIRRAATTVFRPSGGIRSSKGSKKSTLSTMSSRISAQQTHCINAVMPTWTERHSESGNPKASISVASASISSLGFVRKNS